MGNTNWAHKYFFLKVGVAYVTTLQ